MFRANVKKNPVYLKTLSKLMLTPLRPTLFFEKIIFDTVLIMLTSLPLLEFLTKIIKF